MKTLLVNFRNMYGFLSQVIPYQDSDLEQLYTYLRFLLTKLPKRDTGPGYHLEDEVELQYYRLQKISEGQIDLNTGDGKPLKGPSDVGTGQEDQKIKLSELIDILNERFGTDFTQADQLFFDQIQEEAIESESLKKAAPRTPKTTSATSSRKPSRAWSSTAWKATRRFSESSWPMANSGNWPSSICFQSLSNTESERTATAYEVINLVKAIEKSAEEQSDDPFLVAMAERAKAVQEAFEERQSTTEKALADLVPGDREEHETETGAGGEGPGWAELLRAVQTDGGWDCECRKVSAKIREAFGKHPGWKDGEAELRELRKQVTFAVFSEEDDLDKVAATVESLFMLLEKAFRK